MDNPTEKKSPLQEGLVKPLADDLRILADALVEKVAARNGDRLKDLAAAFRQTVQEKESIGSSDEWMTALFNKTVCKKLQGDTPYAVVVVAEIVELATRRLGAVGRAAAAELVASILDPTRSG